MPALTASRSVAIALSGPVEISVEQIFFEYGWDDSELLSLAVRLGEILEFFELQLDPPLGKGELSDLRVLRRNPGFTVNAQILNTIAEGERFDIEFKSSLVYDRKYAHNCPGKAPSAYKSDKVLQSALKTIAAFANTDGGSLLLGVHDYGDICGIEDDMAALGCSTYDAFELRLRSLVEQHFCDGRAVTAYCAVQRGVFDTGTVLRVQVAKRNRLTVLNFSGSHELYIRDGNRSISISLNDLQNYYDIRRMF